LVLNVGKVTVKLVPAESELTYHPPTCAVLQVTLNFVPAVVFWVKRIWLVAVTLVVLTTHVAPLAAVAQENDPPPALVHVTTEGLAAVPTPAQTVAVENLVACAEDPEVPIDEQVAFTQPHVTLPEVDPR